MKRTHLRGGAIPSAALLVAGLVGLAPPATLEAQSAARGDGAKVASAAVWAGGVDFTPTVRYREAVITVSGNGRVFRQAVQAGSLSIGVFDPEGQLLPDGVYKWELELVPDARTAEKLRVAAAQNGGVAPNAWQRESGTFAIHNGLVVAPDLVEPLPVRPEAAAGSVVPSEVGAASADRLAAGDDDSAVGSRKGVEASMRAAALESQPQAAAAGRPPLEGEALERSDAAARALGASLERTPAAVNLSGEAEPSWRSILESNDPENGRDRSEKHR